MGDAIVLLIICCFCIILSAIGGGLAYSYECPRADQSLGDIINASGACFCGIDWCEAGKICNASGECVDQPVVITTPCTNNPCQHGGVCSVNTSVTPHTAVCNCSGTGFTGEHCDTSTTEPTDPCGHTQITCQHGIKHPFGDTCKCNCEGGWTGEDCNTPKLLWTNEYHTENPRAIYHYNEGTFSWVCKENYYGNPDEPSNHICHQCSGTTFSALGSLTEAACVPWIAGQNPQNPPEETRNYSSVNVDSGNDLSMLDAQGAWSPAPLHAGSGPVAAVAPGAPAHWMHIDLGSVMRVTGIVSQGRWDPMVAGNAGWQSTQQVTSFKVKYSTDNGHTGADVTDWNPVDGILLSAENGGDHAFKSESLFPAGAVTARHVRIMVQAYNGWPSMRAGVLIEDTEDTEDPVVNLCTSDTDCFVGTNTGLTDLDTEWKAANVNSICNLEGICNVDPLNNQPYTLTQQKLGYYGGRYKVNADNKIECVKTLTGDETCLNTPFTMNASSCKELDSGATVSDDGQTCNCSAGSRMVGSLCHIALDDLCGLGGNLESNDEINNQEDPLGGFNINASRIPEPKLQGSIYNKNIGSDDGDLNSDRYTCICDSNNPVNRKGERFTGYQMNPQAFCNAPRMDHTIRDGSAADAKWITMYLPELYRKQITGKTLNNMYSYLDCGAKEFTSAGEDQAGEELEDGGIKTGHYYVNEYGGSPDCRVCRSPGTNQIKVSEYYGYGVDTGLSGGTYHTNVPDRATYDTIKNQINNDPEDVKDESANIIKRKLPDTSYLSSNFVELCTPAYPKHYGTIGETDEQGEWSVYETKYECRESWCKRHGINANPSTCVANAAGCGAGCGRPLGFINHPEAGADCISNRGIQGGEAVTTGRGKNDKPVPSGYIPFEKAKLSGIVCDEYVNHVPGSNNFAINGKCLVRSDSESIFDHEEKELYTVSSGDEMNSLQRVMRNPLIMLTGPIGEALWVANEVFGEAPVAQYRTDINTATPSGNVNPNEYVKWSVDGLTTSQVDPTWNLLKDNGKSLCKNIYGFKKNETTEEYDKYMLQMGDGGATKTDCSYSTSDCILPRSSKNFYNLAQGGSDGSQSFAGLGRSDSQTTGPDNGKAAVGCNWEECPNNVCPDFTS